jgi:hypothetical protein
MREGYQPHQEDQDEQPKNSSRRNFLRGFFAASAVGILAEGCKKADTPNESVIKKTKEMEEQDAEQAEIEHEKKLVVSDIENGLAEEKKFHELLKIYNELVATVGELDKSSDEYSRTIEKMRDILKKIQPMEIYVGTIRIGPLLEASRILEKLRNNEKGLTVLALARVLFSRLSQESSLWPPRLPYVHIYAGMYEMLASVEPEEIKRKIKIFFEQTKKSGKNRVDFNDLMYVLIDAKFDFDLTSQTVSDLLDKKCPGWQKMPYSHINRRPEDSYNILERFSLVDLNRLCRTVEKLGSKDAQKKVFSIRDLDLKNSKAELGGVITFSDDEALRIIDDGGDDNEAYNIGNPAIIEMFRSPSAFHFHATEENEDPNHLGPSSGDQAFISPGIVFTSINKDTVAAHFYKSFIGKNGNISQNVISLGIYKNNK